MATSTNPPPSSGPVVPCGVTSKGIVVPPRELFVLATSAAIAGLALLTFSLLLFTRLERD